MAIKRIISLVLATLIFISAFPLPSYAALSESGSDDTPIWQNNGLVDENGELLSGGVRGYKTATPTENPNEFIINIKAEYLSSDINEQNLMLLVDTSSSADLNLYKKLLADAVTLFYENNPSGNIALATFSKDYKLLQPFAKKENIASLLSDIENITQGSGNYLENAIASATGWLESTGKDNISLAILSAGKASYSSQIATVKSLVACDSGHTNQQWSFIPAYLEPRTVLGNGQSMIRGLSLNAPNIPDASCNGVDQHIYNGEQYPKNHGVTAIYEAGLARNAGIKIHSICFAGEPAQLSIMRELSSTGCSTSSAEALSFIETITPDKKGVIENLHISDSIPPYATSTVSSKDGEQAFAEITGRHELQYTLTLNPEHEDYPSSVEVPLGQHTQIHYIRDGEPEGIQLKQPSTKSVGYKIFIAGYSVDEAGNPLDASGKVVSIGDAEILFTTGYLNTGGLNQWFKGEKVSISAKNIAENGYSLYPEESTSKNITVDDNTTVLFAFVKHNLSYTVEHFLENKTSEPECFDTQVVCSVKKGTKVTSVPRSPKADLLKLSRTDNIPVTINDNNQKISLFYKVSDPTEETYNYSVCIYKDDIKDEEMSFSGFVNADNPTLGYSINDSLFPGYRLSNVLYSNIINLGDDSYQITGDNARLDIKYTKTESIKYTYTVEYYRDNILHNNEKKTISPESSITFPGSIYPGLFSSEGYQLSSASLYRSPEDISSLDVNKDENLVIEGNNCILKLYYSKLGGLSYNLPINYVLDNKDIVASSYTGSFGETIDIPIYQIPDGYALDRIAITPKADSPGELTHWADVELLTVYCKADTALPYTVDFYLQNAIGSVTHVGSKCLLAPIPPHVHLDKDFLFSSDAQNKIELKYIEFSGEKASSVEATITSVSNRVKVVFAEKDSGQTAPPEENLVAVPITLNFNMNGQVLSLDQNFSIPFGVPVQPWQLFSKLSYGGQPLKVKNVIIQRTLKTPPPLGYSPANLGYSATLGQSFGDDTPDRSVPLMRAAFPSKTREGKTETFILKENDYFTFTEEYQYGIILELFPVESYDSGANSSGGSGGRYNGGAEIIDRNGKLTSGKNLDNYHKENALINTDSLEELLNSPLPRTGKPVSTDKYRKNRYLSLAALLALFAVEFLSRRQKFNTIGKS